MRLAVDRRRRRDYRLEDIHNQSFRGQGQSGLAHAQTLRQSRTRGVCMDHAMEALGHCEREAPQGAAAPQTYDHSPASPFRPLYTLFPLLGEMALHSPTDGLS